MATLPQLVNAASYRPCDWDLRVDAAGRRYWVDLFCQHLELLAELIAAEYPQAGPKQLAAFRQDYLATMRAFLEQPERFERMDVLRLTQLRRDVQRRHGFEDPFAGLKRRENQAAAELLPSMLAGLDAAPPQDRLEALIVGLMAGNVFDLGALPTIDRYRAGQAGFVEARRALPARPWFRDDLDAWAQRWRNGGGYRSVLFFVDNAGSDICLGCLPLVRWMLQAGARVTLAANAGPALNDITAPELTELLEQIGPLDRTLHQARADQRLVVRSTGNDLPLLDLRSLPSQFAAAVQDADLVIFHGMGRAIESNFRSRLRCDAVRSAVLKDPAVARHVGGKLFDCIFRFQPADQPA